MNLFAKPFVNWVGGKFKLAETILKEVGSIVDLHDFDSYVDPFVGGVGCFSRLPIVSLSKGS